MNERRQIEKMDHHIEKAIDAYKKQSESKYRSEKDFWGKVAERHSVASGIRDGASIHSPCTISGRFKNMMMPLSRKYSA